MRSLDAQTGLRCQISTYARRGPISWTLAVAPLDARPRGQADAQWTREKCCYDVISATLPLPRLIPTPHAPWRLPHHAFRSRTLDLTVRRRDVSDGGLASRSGAAGVERNVDPPGPWTGDRSCVPT